MSEVMVMPVKKRLFFGGNWKAFMRPSKTAGFIAGFADGVKPHIDDLKESGTRVVIASPSACLTEARRALDEQGLREVVELAVQDPWFVEGAYTGATTFEAAADPLIGARYALIGHSETREPHRIYCHQARAEFKPPQVSTEDALVNLCPTLLSERQLAKLSELDSGNPKPFRVAIGPVVNRTTRKALSAGIVPIVCVGETLEEREAGKTQKTIEFQMAAALEGFTPEQIAKMVVAYEPVWAIGTGRTATPEQAQEVHAQIAGILMGRTKTKENTVPIIYGGSMKPDNAASLVKQPDIWGGLIGGASLKPDVFLQLIMNGIQSRG